MTIAALLVGFSLVQGQTPKEPAPALKMKTYQFVFLRKGADLQLTAAESQKTMQSHLQNLERLWLTEGKAVLVGPFTDNGDIRGIVVLDASAEEAKKLMDEDPYVKIGAMKADIRPLMAAEGFLRKPPKFMDLMGYTVGFYKRPQRELPNLEEEESKKLMTAHLANNEKMWKAGALVWAGPFLDNTNIRGLLVFRITDQEKIKALIAEDPLVKLGRLEAELHPAMTAKGAFPPLEKPGG
jgi:uncharacterized protein YciI